MHTPITILLAEDDPDDSFLFQEALNAINPDANLTIVQDGEMLIERLAKISKAPELIFLDLNMPRKDGYSCLVEIRSKQQLRAIPVVILSTSSNEQSVDSAYQAGANLYIRKPDNFNDLVKAIGICLAQLEKLTQKPPKDSFLLTF